jgi:NAD(P)-dependent dehydrogenase (short-subunit alcohol dehydrogenase family)
MSRLVGRTALVTGGAQGLGRGIALAFASEGANIALLDVRLDRARATALEVTARGVEAEAFLCDVSVRSDVVATVQQSVDRFGGIDVLVNCAHRVVSGVAIEDMTDELMDDSWRSGALGTLACMQACFPHLRVRGGSIINIGSGAGLEGLGGYSAYAPVKEAIRCLTKVAAREWGRHRIRVNTLCPHAATPPWEKFAREQPERAASFVERNALGWGPGDPEIHIGRAAVFLASSDSEYVTGQTLFVDGGSYLL